MPRLPLSSEIVAGLGGSIDAGLLKGEPGAVALLELSATGNTTLTIVYRDENNAEQTIAFTPSGGGGGVDAAFIQALTGIDTDANLHSNNLFIVRDNAGNLVKAPWSALLQFLRSSAGLGSHLLPASPAEMHRGDAWGPVVDPSDASATIWGYIHIGNDAIPRYNHIPDGTATSPDLIHLTHDYFTGTQTDATFEMSFDVDRVFNGYNDGLLGTRFGSTTNSNAPVRRLVTSGASTAFTLAEIWSESESFLENISRVSINGTLVTLAGSVLAQSGLFYRTIPDAVDKSDASVTFNIQRMSDSSWVYVALGAEILHERGLYAKFTDDNGVTFGYGRVGAAGVFHFAGVGRPAEDPARAGVIQVNDDGAVYVSAGQQRIVHTDSTATDAAFSYSRYVRGDVSGNPDQLINFGDGAFNRPNSHLFPFEFISYQNTTIVYDTSWYDVWDYILSNVFTMAGADRTQALHLRDNVVYLGTFNTLLDAREELDSRGISGFTGLDAETFTYVYMDVGGSIFGLRYFTEYVEPSTATNDTLRWVGALATESFVNQVILDNLEANTTAKSTAFLRKIKVIDQKYDVWTDEDLGRIQGVDKHTALLHDMEEITSAARTWLLATDAQGGLVQFKREAAPTATELENAVWTEQVGTLTVATDGLMVHTVIRVPLSNSVTNYRMMEVTLDGVVTEYTTSSLLDLIHTDATYHYYDRYVRSAGRGGFTSTLQHDNADTTVTNFTGEWNGHLSRFLTRTEFDAISVKDPTTLYFVTD